MNTDTLPVTPGPMPPEWVDILIVLGVILAVALAVFFWAVIFRTEGKSRHKHRHHHHHHHHRTSYREQFKIGVGGIKELFRRHRHHRPINPTLAETGGLPPLRGPDKPPPPPPP